MKLLGTALSCRTANDGGAARRGWFAKETRSRVGQPDRAIARLRELCETAIVAPVCGSRERRRSYSPSFAHAQRLVSLSRNI